MKHAKTASSSARQTAAPAVSAGKKYSYCYIGRENGQKKRSGFTLIELLVYIAIMGFIIVVAGRAFSDATGMRIRSQNMLGSAEEAGRVSALLKEDISQLGTKSWGSSSASGTAFDTVNSVYVNYNDGNPGASNTDLSSYVLTRNHPQTSASSYDSLWLRKAHFDANGACAGVLTVEWYVRTDTLFRKCTPLNPKPARCTGTLNTAECPSGVAVEMARDVASFRLLPSVPGIEGSSSASSADTLFPSSGNAFKFLYKKSDGEEGEITNRILNYPHFLPNSSSSGTHHTNFYLAEQGQADCKRFTFKKGEEYAISFDLPYLPNQYDLCKSTGTTDCPGNVLNARYNKMSMFQAGRDHLSVGLRNTAMNGQLAGGVPDFLFYPPQDTEADKVKTRHFEFSVPSDVDNTACLGITAAFYSQAANGHLDIENFKVYRKTDNIYHFNRSSGSNYNPSASSKAGVKAFELTLGINKRGEINRAITVIPVPNNGVLAGGP